MEILLATGLWARLSGLLKKDCCTQGEVLLLAPCKSIHTFGMSSALDIAFLDKEAKVLSSERSVSPGRVRSHPQAVAVLERRCLMQEYWPAAGERLQLKHQYLPEKRALDAQLPLPIEQ